ncbi:hypothetical protein ACUN7Z_00570 [Vreelandella venusta]|uniref:hypothetical protein n=1 Tax=Vreelandella venusta TaxID=44935 RepID=UPI004043B18D
MADLLHSLWMYMSMPFSDPRVAAAVPAFILSWLIGNRNTALACAVIAFCTINLIFWLSGLPYDGEYQLPVETAGGIGAGMALIGVHGIQERVNQINLKTIIQSVTQAIADAFRGRR